ncbi:MAG: hypothetical protein ACYDB7_03285 [Mycobacteriales bacterium]
MDYTGLVCARCNHAIGEGHCAACREALEELRQHRGPRLDVVALVVALIVVLTILASARM